VIDLPPRRTDRSAALLFRILNLLLLCCVVGCVRYPEIPQIPDSTASPELYAPHPEPSYPIQIGDVLTVRSYYNPNLDQEVLVRPDGRISLLLIGDVEVAGMTPSELNKLVSDSYRKLSSSTDAVVSVKESSGLSVYLMGEVKNPAMHRLQGSLTLMQAVAESGGFLPTANRSEIVVLRRQANGRSVGYKVDGERILSQEAADPYLVRADIVYVPKSQIANVDQFVDQYINQIIPRLVLTTFGVVYNINPVAEIKR
jgi:protein involved in polysaccharide export with SLBB domain